MPILEYKCKREHVTERLALAKKDRDRDTVHCATDGCALVAYLVFSRTGKPNLKEGSGGFYSPSKP